MFSRNLKVPSESLSLTVFDKVFLVCGAKKWKARLVKSLQTKGSASCELVVERRVLSSQSITGWRKDKIQSVFSKLVGDSPQLPLVECTFPPLLFFSPPMMGPTQIHLEELPLSWRVSCVFMECTFLHSSSFTAVPDLSENMM